MNYRLLTTVLCSLITLGSVIQADPTRPKLVVGIVVDQLRTDYLEYLRSMFAQGGFNKLMTDGVYLRNVDFKGANPDIVSATAALYTGATPAKTGVPSAIVFDPSAVRARHVLADSHDSYSPEALRLSTISDEIAVDGLGLGLVYSLSADPGQAVIMAGHAGTSAYWLNENNGRWSTSPYYKETVPLMTGRAARAGIDARIDTMQWKPMLSLDKYPGLPAQKKIYPFRYTFPRSDREVYSRFNASPLANREITDVAIEYLRQLKLGSRSESIDMLNIGYTAAPYKYAKDADIRLELQDSYLRLDKDIDRLLSAIDKYVGLSNTLIYLSSTGYYQENGTDDAKYRIPTGNFSARRAISLLNAYLSAKYGNAQYIAAYHNGHFFLEARTLEAKRLQTDEVAVEAALFLSQMAGVQETYTQKEIISALSGDAAEIRNSVDIKHAGHIIVDFTPGWTVTDDTSYPETTHTVRSAMVATPFFIMGPGLPAQTISDVIDASLLAPTVTSTLRIRSPNGASSRPLLFQK